MYSLLAEALARSMAAASEVLQQPVAPLIFLCILYLLWMYLRTDEWGFYSPPPLPVFVEERDSDE